MNGCVYKRPSGRCDKLGRYLSPCIGEACEHQTPSHFDRIVSMTPEEMAQAIEEFSYDVVTCPKDKCHLEPMSPYDSLDRNECRKCWLKWLTSPADPGEGNDGKTN